MKTLKVLIFSIIAVIGMFFFTSSVNANAEEINQNSSNITNNMEIEPYGSKTIYHTIRAAKLSGLPNNYVYNDGVYCGQLRLNSWSYEKDFSTGKMWYVGIYRGTVSTGGCPIARSFQNSF